MNTLAKNNWKAKNEFIYKRLKSKQHFYELEYIEKIEILKALKRKKIEPSVVQKSGYDPITKKYFAELCSLKLDTPQNELIIQKQLFTSFGEYYDFLEGNIYKDSCFYGSTISKEDKKKYSLDLRKLNFNAFINDNIDDSDSLTLTKQRENEISNSTITFDPKEIAKWFSTLKEIKTYEQFCLALNNFKETPNGAKEIFFSLMYQKYGDAIKDIIIKYIGENDIYCGFNIESVLNCFGFDAIKQLDSSFNFKADPRTIRRRRNECVYLYNQVKKGIFKRYIEGGFRNGLYYAFVYYCDEPKVYAFRSRDLYFLFFDDLKQYLSNDLRGFDFSKSPLQKEDAKDCIYDETTLFSDANNSKNYLLKKYYENNLFCVEQIWTDSNGKTLIQDKKVFDSFCDFVFFLKNDLSNGNYKKIPNFRNLLDSLAIKYDGSKFMDESKTKEWNRHELLLTKAAKQNELMPLEENERSGPYIDESIAVGYISDLHIDYKIDKLNRPTIFDVEEYVEKAVKNLKKSAQAVNLVAGDITCDPALADLFIRDLCDIFDYQRVFFTLGNHELWPFKNKSIAELVQLYKKSITSENVFLVHNNAYVLSNGLVISELNTERILKSSIEELRKMAEKANLIIFGGIGFSGCNEQYNATSGLYGDLITREQEIEESKLFATLHKKICEAFYDKNVIVLTHMGFENWNFSQKRNQRFAYVSGHNHRNYFSDGPTARIFEDNQLGYDGNDYCFKKFEIDKTYKAFSDYKDGIFEITRADYKEFYAGLNYYMAFNRDFEKIYMLKKDDVYMFLCARTLSNERHLYLLDGGAIKNLENNDLNYYYRNMEKYASSVKQFFAAYKAKQEEISRGIRDIGGEGSIHGCIVDIDFNNHLYLNPLDGTLTPYFAYSVTEKYVYKNLPSLLKSKRSDLFTKYNNLLETSKKNALIISPENNTLTSRTTYVESTEIYKISGIFKSFQYLYLHNVIRRWNDNFLKDKIFSNRELPQKIFLIKEDQNEN